MRRKPLHGMKDKEVNDCIVRSARASEAKALSELAFRSKAHWGYSDAFMQSCRNELTYTPQQIESERFSFAVADANGSTVGFYALEQLSPDEVELEALFVEPHCIGKGYGRTLVAHAKDQAAKMGARSLLIQGDPNAERFYKAVDGVPVGTRESGSVRGRYLPLFKIDLATGDAE